jgi:hypothetical protein
LIRASHVLHGATAEKTGHEGDPAKPRMPVSTS